LRVVTAAEGRDGGSGFDRKHRSARQPDDF
jgi:hypothetical protein